ncbi:oligosaccharide flippase family protein [soil metagenome]
MSSLKKLASQTAVYGLSSIVGRMLNYLLVPLYTRVFVTGEYGIVTELYAFVSFFNIVFTYGLETAFFRFAEKEKGNPRVYSTSLISIIASSISLAVVIILFSSPIASWMNHSDGSDKMLPQYISCFAIVLALDAISAIPFAKLRQEHKAFRFATIKIIWILVNVGLNIFFLIFCPKYADGIFHDFISHVYDPSIGIGYVFISNLVASAVVLLCLAPEILKTTYFFDKKLWNNMLVYALPLMVAGFAGMINETFDRIMLPRLTPDKSTALSQLGIYGACYKLSILMSLFVQTFRYAAEPFFFSQASSDKAQQIYSRVMHYFVLMCAFIFLAIMMYMDIVKGFIGKEYREGLGVVPILLMANLCLGVFYNLSIWYKLTHQTKWGAWLSIIGAIITLVLNFSLIPVMGYMGAAWATLICYAAMMVLSYFIGQKYYHVNYNIGSFIYFVSAALIFYFISEEIRIYFTPGRNSIFFINTLILLAFLAVSYLYERHKKPYIRIPEKITTP